jgi:FAD synthetase
MTTAMLFGTFDGVQPSHEHMLKQAHRHADKIIVVIARDSTVKALKGKKPLRNEEERLQAVSEHPLVDQAVLGGENDKYAVIKHHKPNVICLGHGQAMFTDRLAYELAKAGLDVKIVRLESYRSGRKHLVDR